MKKVFVLKDKEVNAEQIIAVNPLSPNSDQQQFSPNGIHTLSRDEVMRIN